MYTSPLTQFRSLLYFLIFLVAVETYPDCSTKDGVGSMYFSHEEDCDSFWQCSNGRPYLFKCPPTLHFNSELNVCDYPQNVGCITSTEDSSQTTATENIFISTTEQPSTTTRPTTTTQKISTTKSTKLVPMCPTQSSRRSLPTYITQKITTPSVTTTADTTPITSTTSSTTTEIISSDTTVPIVISTNNFSLITSDTSTEAETATEHVTREITSTISDVTNAQTDTDDSTEHKITDIVTSSTNIVDLSSTTDIVDSSVATNTPDEKSSTSLTTISSPEDIITNSITSTENMDYLCELSSEYFFTAHPKSCYLYIACSFGTAYVLNCYGNKWFNSFTSTCVEPANSDCNRSRLIPIHIDTETEIYSAPLDNFDFICDNEITGTYKYHPFDCEKFVVCVHGYPAVMNCPKGLHFDLSLKQCVYSYESKCSLAI